MTSPTIHRPCRSTRSNGQLASLAAAVAATMLAYPAVAQPPPSTPFLVGVDVQNITPCTIDWVRDRKCHPDWIRTQSNDIWKTNVGLQPTGVDLQAMLSARAIIVTTSSGKAAPGKRLAIVTLDVVGFAAEFSAEVRKRLASSIGLLPEEVIVTATHTHSGTAMKNWPHVPLDGHPMPAYVDGVLQKTVRAVEVAMSRLSPAALRFSRGTTTIGRARGWVPPDKYPPYDAVQDTLEAIAPDGETLAVLFTHGAHPVTTFGSPLLGADYPAYARRLIEEQRGMWNQGGLLDGRAAIFLQGFAGDVNADLIAGGETAAQQVGNTVAQEVTSILENQNRTFLAGSVSVRHRTLPLLLNQAFPNSGGPFAYDRFLPTEVSMALIGTEGTIGGWRLVASAHEPSSGFAPSVRDLWNQDKVTVIGYAHAVESYLSQHNRRSNLDNEAWDYESFDSFYYYNLHASIPVAGSVGLWQDSEYVENGIGALRANPGWWSVDTDKQNAPSSGVAAAANSRPAATSFGNQRTDVFIRRSDGQILQKSWPAAGWRTIPGAIAASDPTAVSWGCDGTGIPGESVLKPGNCHSGRIDLFYRTAQNTLGHAFTPDGESWSTDNLTTLAGGSLASDAVPTAVSWGPGRLDVFARGPDNQLDQWLYQLGSYGDRWLHVRPRLADVKLRGTPAVTASKLNSIEIFTRDANNSLRLLFHNDGVWSNWQNFGPTLTSSPASASPVPGEVHVFFRGTNNSLWRGKVTIGAGIVPSWSGYTDAGTCGFPLTGDPSAATRSPRSLDVFTIDSGKGVCHLSYTDSTYRGTVRLGPTVFGSPFAVRVADGIELFARGTKNYVWRHRWNQASVAGRFDLDPSPAANGILYKEHEGEY